MKNARLAILIFSLGIMALPFQNCSDVQFSQISAKPTDNPVPDGFKVGSLDYQQPNVEITKKVDILFVTDTSSSLDDERTTIANNIGSFVGALPSDVDYTLAVLLAHGPQSAQYGHLYRQASNTPYVLKSSELTPGSTYSQALKARLTNIPSDNDTDGGEVGQLALRQLLDANLAEARAQGFFRANAALAIVFISDENDICAVYPAGVTPVPDSDNLEQPARARYCAGVTAANTYAKLIAVQGELPLLVGGVIYTDPATVPSGGENEVGYGYTDLIALNHGLAVDIGGNIPSGLQAIGQLVSQKLNLKTTFTLSDPDLLDCSVQLQSEGIEVRVDGGLVSTFSYMPGSCTVQIPAASAGTANSQVHIEFTFSDPPTM